MFISTLFTKTSIDETNKTQQKVRGLKFMFKMSTIHANTCIQTTTPLHNRCRDDGVVQQPPLAQQTFFQLLHIMDPQTVDPLLKDIPDVVVHWIKIWRDRSGGTNYDITLCSMCHILLKNESERISGRSIFSLTRWFKPWRLQFLFGNSGINLWEL